MRVQMFEATSVGGKEELFRFKEILNNWLAENQGKVEIKHIFQNMCAKASSHIYLVTVWYESIEPTPSELEEDKKEAENPFAIQNVS